MIPLPAPYFQFPISEPRDGRDNLVTHEWNAWFLQIRNMLNGTAGAAISTSISWSNGAGALAGTLLNSPVAGNPTKWLPIDDNGTTRYIPAW